MELFSLISVIADVGITRNSGVLAELTYLLVERIALIQSVSGIWKSLTWLNLVMVVRF